MRKGDLVYIFNYNAGSDFTRTMPKIGLVIGCDDDSSLANQIHVLVDGKIAGYNGHELMRLGEHNETR